MVKSKNKNRRIQITVKDTGVGIKEENLLMMFKEFCSLEEHQKLNPNGTGLGLYLSKRFAKLMEGTIEVKSKYGKGTKFTVSLPPMVHNESPTKIMMHKRNNHSNEELKPFNIENYIRPLMHILSLLSHSGRTLCK